MTISRLPRFGRLDVDERRRRLGIAAGLAPTELSALDGAALPLDVADGMIENVVGTFALPLAVGLNFVVDGRDVLVPMVVEEPSVVAAASSAALLARDGGGFETHVDAGMMIGQIQLVDLADAADAVARLRRARPRLVEAARALVPRMCARGAGPRDVEVRRLDTRRGPTVVVHVLVDTGDAMGANVVNTLVEALAPAVAEIGRGRIGLRILSNLADRRLARAAVRIPQGALARGGLDGSRVAARIVEAWELAAVDPYRAATHNKGAMNGIDAVALATGNDWRAIEAGAHAYACRDGAYRPLTTWTVEGDLLAGAIELPLAMSTVGPLTTVHPRIALALRVLATSSASDGPSSRELAAITASVGLASNLAALRALVTDGIQAGHMPLHARAVARAARGCGASVAIEAGAAPRVGR